MGGMWQLYQFPLCPFSRKVRLLLGEKGVGYELVRESPWQRRDEFLDMNPAGQTPVMVDEERGVLLVDSMAISEFFEETVEKSAMINGTAVGRAEIRRLVTWFDTHFYQDVTGPLLHERMVKRVARTGSPDAKGLREAMKAAVGHLDYTDYLLDHRNWLGGATMSLADLAAAAQISVADYLGGIDPLYLQPDRSAGAADHTDAALLELARIGTALAVPHRPAARQCGVAAGGDVGVEALHRGGADRHVDRHPADAHRAAALSGRAHHTLSRMDDVAPCQRVARRRRADDLDRQRLAVGRSGARLCGGQGPGRGRT